MRTRNRNPLLPLGACLLLASAVAGQHTERVRVDSTGAWELPVNVPPGLSGLSLGFRAYAFGRGGGIVESKHDAPRHALIAPVTDRTAKRTANFSRP